MTNDDASGLIDDATSQTEKARVVRPKRPNIHELYAWPLPIETFPIPSFLPHNPLSIISVAVVYLSQIFFPPSSVPLLPYHGYLSKETGSVHVTDERTIRALWEKGFFGKGTLSRSEPNWLDGEKRRRGILANQTSEEITNKRRNERKQFKLERARKEQEVIEQRLVEERKMNAIRNGSSDREGQHENDSKPTLDSPELEKNATDTRHEETIELTAKALAKEDRDSTTLSAERMTVVDQYVPKSTAGTLINANSDQGSIVSQEHLQLTMEEAFFLSYGLGVLRISHQNESSPIATDALLESFRMNSYFPPVKAEELRPDDPFLVSYVVYHHFRSLGWVVRPGIKFAVDYLLYNRGPVFSHAEFAVIILPAYSHRYYHETEAGRKAVSSEASKPWWWLHCVNRVQSQVRKSLVLVYVEIPPPEQLMTTNDELESKTCKGDVQQTHIGHLLRRYKVREIGLKRWLPNRSKD